ncbi:hypothetical protein DVJ77_13675 [Dyella tabacisoli]|uniref:Transmembrane signal peptide protein n=2 Tax=Dyella tabacisoli TaxID=2282381 RepID=A0A369UMV2_9GAMM|nr:hypothetical protein DVJ77_13675 [Dyella tabacisoli]
MLALSVPALATPLQGFSSPQDYGHDRGRGDDDRGNDHDRGHGHDKDRGHGRDDDDRRGEDYGRHDNGRHRGWDKHYERGERLPEQYRVREYYVDDYARYHLHEPRRGYRWVRGDNDGEFVLIAITTGVIVEILNGR